VKKLTGVLKYLALFGISAFLFCWVYKDFDYRKLWQDVQHMNYLYVAIGFVILTLSHVSRAMRWNIMIRPLGYEVSTRNSFIAVMIGYLANLFLPRAGEVSRCMVLNRTNKVPVDKLIGTVVTERLVDFLVLLILLGVALIIEFNKLKGFFINALGKLTHKQPGAGSSLFTFWKVFTAVVFLAFFAWLAWYLYRTFRNHKMVVKARGILMGFADGLRSIQHMENRGMFIFHSFFIWTMYFLMTYVMFKSLDSTSGLGLAPALSVLVMSTFGFVVPVQGGAGTYDFAVIQTLLLYGLNQTAAETYAFVSHAFQMILQLVWGGICALWLTTSFKKIKAHGQPVAAPEAEAVQS
jgi:hypothetical protein